MGPKKAQPASKKKGISNKSNVANGDNDDDWEALLEAESSATNSHKQQQQQQPQPESSSAQEKKLQPSNRHEEDEDDTDEDHEAGTDTHAKSAAAAFLASQGIDVSGAGGGNNDASKKKKKKKKPSSVSGGGEEQEQKDEKAGADAPKKQEKEKISAKGKLIAERLRRQKEEEDRIRALEEAERQRIAAIEAAEEAERLRIEAEKEAKRKKRLERIEQQKKDGTYMTKTQRAKAALNQKRLEATMKAAGIHVGVSSLNDEDDDTDDDHEVDEGDTQADPSQQLKERSKTTTSLVETKDEALKKKKVIYESKKKKKSAATTDMVNRNELVEDKKDELGPQSITKLDQGTSHNIHETLEKNKDNEEPDDWETGLDRDENLPSNRQKDDWEESDSVDEWDIESDDDVDIKFQDLESKLKQIQVHVKEDEEDLVEKEKRREQEHLRQLGIERQERERVEAEKRAKMLSEQRQLELQEQLKIQKRLEGKRKREEQERMNLEARNREILRCPIVVVMGHVDTGKTSLLDKIRKTNVQLGEAGGITQQIGATYFEKKTLEAQTSRLNAIDPFDITIPGMLVIDTPGHESFTNLRTRGSSLCDIAILVVDLMHGLEQQTIESLNMLRSRDTPFVVALNKVDRCYAWNTSPDTPIRETLKHQPEGTLSEFRSRALDAKIQLQEQGINSNLYWEMGDEDWTNSDFVPLVPTSAITGEGVQDILQLICRMAQVKIWRQLMWHANLQATVMEVKAIDGLGMTVDVLLVNGYLREGDRAVFCTLDGPIITEIRGLLTPPPSREMRVKADYIHHKEIKGAIGVKVIGNNLEKVMAGTPVLVIGADDEEEDIKSEVMSDLAKLQEKLSVDKKGVMVQASTLGALEALLQFLREDTKPPIPVSAIGIGAIHKRDVTKISVMNEKGCPEFATILAFDVDINPEAREHAQEVGVRIFTADIIYHLFDQFTRFMEDLSEKRRQEAAAVAVFPSIVKILPQHIFNQKDPIILGVEVVDGVLKVGTPLCVPALGGLHIGKVISIESNGKEQDIAKKGTSVAIKIVNESNPTLTYGRQFDSSHSLYSTLTRASIDALKANFKDKLDTDDWKLVIKLKKVFSII